MIISSNDWLHLLNVACSWAPRIAITYCPIFHDKQIMLSNSFVKFLEKNGWGFKDPCLPWRGCHLSYGNIKSLIYTTTIVQILKMLPLHFEQFTNVSFHRDTVKCRIATHDPIILILIESEVFLDPKPVLFYRWDSLREIPPSAWAFAEKNHI